MRKLDYDSFETNSIPCENKTYITLINQYKNEQLPIYQKKSQILDKMVRVAKIQSAGASNRIEGVSTCDKRLKHLMEETVEPIGKAENEIRGYRFCLDLIHEKYDSFPVTPENIRQLHAYLFQYLSDDTGGKYKTEDNLVVTTDLNGNIADRFEPVSAADTPSAIEDLCAAFNIAIEKGAVPPLLLILQFVFDFLCIQPFCDGNGRMSRLLMFLLLYRSGYYVGRYISLDAMIEKTKDSYFNSLWASAEGWHEGKYDPGIFICYILGIILSAYREFENRVTLV